MNLKSLASMKKFTVCMKTCLSFFLCQRNKLRRVLQENPCTKVILLFNELIIFTPNRLLGEMTNFYTPGLDPQSILHSTFETYFFSIQTKWHSVNIFVLWKEDAGMFFCNTVIFCLLSVVCSLFYVASRLSSVRVKLCFFAKIIDYFVQIFHKNHFMQWVGYSIATFNHFFFSYMPFRTRKVLKKWVFPPSLLTESTWLFSVS